MATGMLAQQNPEPPLAPAPASPAEKPQSINKKQESSGAARYAYEAADATRRAGELALVKARDWESGWFTGVYVPKGQTMTPLTLGRRRQYYLQQTLVTPGLSGQCSLEV